MGSTILKTPEYFIEVTHMPWDDNCKNQMPCKMFNFKWALNGTRKFGGITIAIFKIYIKHGQANVNPGNDTQGAESF